MPTRDLFGIANLVVSPTRYIAAGLTYGYVLTAAVWFA